MNLAADFGAAAALLQPPPEPRRRRAARVRPEPARRLAQVRLSGGQPHADRVPRRELLRHAHARLDEG